MDKDVRKLLEKVKKAVGESTDILIITHRDGQCAAMTHGNTDDLAHAYFGCMHDRKSNIGSVLYKILKLNTLNVINNHSVFSMDLINAITSHCLDESEGTESVESENDSDNEINE